MNTAEKVEAFDKLRKYVKNGIPDDVSDIREDLCDFLNIGFSDARLPRKHDKCACERKISYEALEQLYKEQSKEFKKLKVEYDDLRALHNYTLEQANPNRDGEIMRLKADIAKLEVEKLELAYDKAALTMKHDLLKHEYELTRKHLKSVRAVLDMKNEEEDFNSMNEDNPFEPRVGKKVEVAKEDKWGGGKATTSEPLPMNAKDFETRFPR